MKWVNGMNALCNLWSIALRRMLSTGGLTEEQKILAEYKEERGAWHGAWDPSLSPYQPFAYPCKNTTQLLSKNVFQPEVSASRQIYRLFCEDPSQAFWKLSALAWLSKYQGWGLWAGGAEPGGPEPEPWPFWSFVFQQQVEAKAKVEGRETWSPVNCSVLLSLILFRWWL